LSATLAALAALWALARLRQLRRRLAEQVEAARRAERQLERQVQALEARGAEREALLAGLRDGVLVLDRQGRVHGANPAAVRLLGLQALPPGARLEELGTARELLLALREGWLRPGVERELALEAGPACELRLWTTLLPQAGRGEERLLAVLSDVGERNRAERLRRDFVANVSHELKTPVTAIRGYAETLLEGDPSTEPARRFLEVIERQARRLDAIIEDLLDLSRIERLEREGGPALEEAPLEPLLRGVLEAHEPQAARVGVRLDLALEDAPALIRANAPLLERALANLLGNALRYGGEGTAVTLRAAPAARGGRAGLRLEVRDQGPGIAAEHLPRLFERFYVVDRARSRQLGGTGLGLAIVKHAMATQGGEAGVESEPGRGSCFWLWLPL
jgi:two-component system phosphate regulon sensor histidine kinase PhoR